MDKKTNRGNDPKIALTCNGEIQTYNNQPAIFKDAWNAWDALVRMKGPHAYACLRDEGWDFTEVDVS